MTAKDWAILAWSAYLALLAILGIAIWHKKRLIAWAREEQLWLRKENEELQVMRKFLMQQFTWDATSSFYGNPVMTAAFNGRVVEYERRRAQMIGVLDKLQKVLPW